MKKLLSVGTILLSLQINAQISFNTGNAEMDKELNEINTIA